MIKQKFLVDFGSKFFNYFLTAVIGILVSRILGPEVVGTVTFGYSYVTTFFFMFGLFGTSHIKLISQGEKLEDCIKIYTWIILMTFVIFIITVLLFFYYQKKILNIPFEQDEEIIIYITIIMIGIEGLFKIPDITFTALVQQLKINIPKLANSILFSAGRILVLVLGYKAIALVSARLIAVVLIIPIYLFLMKKDFKYGKWRIDLFYEYLKIGFPLLIITISLSLISNYSIVLLKNYSSINEVGYFTGGLGLASVFVMIGGTAGDMFLPLFSKSFSAGNYDQIRQQLSKYEHFLFCIILPFLAVLSINSEFIIPFLLGDKYIPSVPIFSVLIFYSFFKIWTIPYYNLLNGMGKYKLNAFTNALFAIIFYSILILFIFPNLLDLGALGLSLSLLILEIIKLSTWYYISNGVIKFNKERVFWKFLLFIFIVYVVSSIMYKYAIIDNNNLIKFLYLMVNFLLIYTLMYFFKLIKKEDIQFILRIFNLKLMKSYIKTELKK